MPARSAPGAWRLVVSCEHGGRRIPRRWKAQFSGRARVLESHVGWDPGALALARRLARALEAPLHATTVSRLLVDANRSAHHRALHAPWIRALPLDERRRIVARHHRPHRERVAREIARRLRRCERVLHLAVHSFTPRLAGVVRDVDVALLYDPARAAERRLCGRGRALLAARLPGLRVRLNRPYRGSDDGLTTALRRCFSASRYAGVELEVSQKHLRPGARHRDEIVRAVEETLRELTRGRRTGASRPGARARRRPRAARRGS